MSRKSLLAGLLLIFAMGQSALAQGVLVPGHDGPHRHWRLPRPIPRPTPVETSYSISELSIDARIEDQVSQTSVSQTFVNTGSRQIEAQFVFPLPYDGAVDQMTFMVDGKEIPAKLLPADEARKIYQGYLRRYQDPALLQWIGHGMFQTNVFPIPPGAKRTVSLRYSQILRKNHALTDYLFPLSTAKYTSKPIETFSFRAAITSKQKLKNIYSPTHDLQITRSDATHAVAKLEKKNYIPSADLRLLFDHNDGPIGASVISYWPNDASEDGYFLLMASPDVKAAAGELTRKTVIFVVDRSGSMNGKKIEQAREAAKFVLNNLREGDLFNIIAYDAGVESFRPELQKYDDESAAAARGFIEGINAGGSTNIDSALSTALKMIQGNSRPSYLLFLTDGLPTAGEQNEARIVKNAKTNNGHGARIISFGVGYDVNSRLLDRLTRANRGQSQYVGPNENLEEHVSRLYEKISAPVLTDLNIAYDFDAMADRHTKPVNRVYPQDVMDIFAGQQLALVGRYKKTGAARVTLSGTVGDEKKSYDYTVEFSEKSADDRFSFVAKLWAARRIGEIIDLIDLEGRNEELIKELVELSTKHGIVTQYTAYLADPNSPPGDLAKSGRLRELTTESLASLDDVAGESGFGQRLMKQQFKSASRVPNQQQLGIALRERRGQAGAEADEVESTVRIVGKDTLYKRGKTLIASNATDVDLEKNKSEITEIERFSDEYFRLIADTTESENKMLAGQADDEELVVRLKGKVYLIK